ncbi:MAG: Gfo/Idh/MocA family oxidoreductase [Gammaproteobacteria bacterium]|nr:Gfo/Idh/MocA family oxidoreductase [Gammaproteobacteria bacterium]
MTDKNDSAPKWSRRGLLKGLGTVPLLGAVWWSGMAASKQFSSKRKKTLNALNIDASAPPPAGSMSGDPIRVGIIGFGGRGHRLCLSLGFATRDWLERMSEAAAKNPDDKRLADWLAQDDQNVSLVGVCDVFDIKAEEALDSFNTETNKIRRYRSYKDMIANPDIDAVVIATPDHWHAPIAIAALEAGKHVYIEKPMTHNIAETYTLREAARKSKGVVMVGHHHRQTQSFLTAQDVIKKNVLGHISLVQVNTNRNRDTGAWQYKIHEEASPQTIDWQQFIGDAPMVPFNTEHFFRWRKWWSYGSGLSGDLLSHDYDRINCVLNMGIPDSVMSSGGIYTHRDGRNVPDVMQVCMDYSNPKNAPVHDDGSKRGMTILYSATLGNEHTRPTLLMGHDGTMELDNRLRIFTDRNSTKYAALIEAGTFQPDIPVFEYDPATEGLDAVTSATTAYFANKGLLWTYRDGKRVDPTYLHLREWLSCIRHGGKPSCGIDEGFEEAITAHMAGLSYKLGRRIDWDPVKEEIVPIPGYDLDEVLLANIERVA